MRPETASAIEMSGTVSNTELCSKARHGGGCQRLLIADSKSALPCHLLEPDSESRGSRVLGYGCGPGGQSESIARRSTNQRKLS